MGLLESTLQLATKAGLDLPDIAKTVTTARRIISIFALT